MYFFKMAADRHTHYRHTIMQYYYRGKDGVYDGV